MKPCPFCGVSLTAALVDSIIDPRQPEFCPSNPPKAEQFTITVGDVESRLLAYALLGSMVTQ